MTDKEREALIARLDDCAAYHQRGDVNEHDTEVSQLCSDAAEALAAPVPTPDTRLVMHSPTSECDIEGIHEARNCGKRQAALAPTPDLPSWRLLYGTIDKLLTHCVRAGSMTEETAALIGSEAKELVTGAVPQLDTLTD